MRVTLGIDIGSRTVKAVLYNHDSGKIINHSVNDVTSTPEKTSIRIFDRLLYDSNIKRENLLSVVATGYSREQFPYSDKKITEITCHAAGVISFNNTVRTVIDIGGQDSKIISIGNNGRVVDFAMNDKCAAGTGRFLEVVERVLEVSLDDMDNLASLSKNPCEISSMCVVFAESEIISFLSQGRDRSDILAGVMKSLAQRIYGQSSKTGIREPVAFTGGVARNKAVVKALQDAFQSELIVPDNPVITGALGAAILAL